MSQDTAAATRAVVIFEVAGGSDKGPDGHRLDTGPLIQALEARGWACEVITYSDASRDAVLRDVRDKADGFIVRINPGRYVFCCCNNASGTPITFQELAIYIYIYALVFGTVRRTKTRQTVHS